MSRHAESSGGLESEKGLKGGGKEGVKSWGKDGLTKVLAGLSAERVLKACKAEYNNPPD